jgi:hypothetical protein
MLGRILSLAALFILASPLGACAEGVNFTVPLHYLVVDPEPQPVQPPVYRVWARYLGGVRHSIVVSATPYTDQLGKIVDAMTSYVNARHGLDVKRADAAPLCGLPSLQLEYAYANQLTYVYRYAVVGNRLLIASYAHPVGTDADPTALAALDTLCSGIHQPATPKGWTIQSPYPPNASAWHPSPSSKTLLDQTASLADPARNLLGPFKGNGTVVADRQDACGAIAIRRTTVNLDDGRILERAAGTAYAYDYIVSYLRPASEAADPGALATLTSFCEGTLPPN